MMSFSVYAANPLRFSPTSAARIAARRRVAVILRVIQPGATRPPARLEEPEDTGQAGNDVLDDSVGAHALERQHCDPRYVGYRVPRRSRRLLRDSPPQRAPQDQNASRIHGPFVGATLGVVGAGPVLIPRRAAG